MSPTFKTNAKFVLALDIFVRRGKRPILIMVDKGTADHMVYELGEDTTDGIIEALNREIRQAEELPVAIETDSAICFAASRLQDWLTTHGIEHRYRSLPPIVEAIIRQNSTDWEGL